VGKATGEVKAGGLGHRPRETVSARYELHPLTAKSNRQSLPNNAAFPDQRGQLAWRRRIPGEREDSEEAQIVAELPRRRRQKTTSTAEVERARSA
jgi:hypothetical protein